MRAQFNLSTLVLGGAAIGLLLVGLYVVKKGVAGAAAGAVTAAADVGAGAVVGIGQVLGIPATNETECEKAKREGRTWDASFACPAGDFLGWTLGGLFRSEGAGTPPPSTGGATGSW